MSDCFVMRSGGAGLNFKVVGGMEQPANPAENTIWVQTDTPVTGYQVSVEEPENPVEGTLWILAGTSSQTPIDATKKNPVFLYPSSAQQYKSGAWAMVDAYTYQDGAWSPWVIYLYDRGDECQGVTGGWKTINGRNDGYTGTGQYTDNGDSYTLTVSGNATAVNRITNSKIDLTNISTIVCEAIEPTTNNFQLIVASTTTINTGTVASGGRSGAGKLEVDVYNLSGSYYVSVQNLNGAYGGNSGKVTVSQIYMVRRDA